MMDLIKWTKHPDLNEIDQKELDILLNLIQKTGEQIIGLQFDFIEFVSEIEVKVINVEYIRVPIKVI